MKLAFSHPGKIGDSLYTLPLIRHLCEQYNCKADFYTSTYCEPLRSLSEHQSYIDRFFTLDAANGYQLRDFGCGGQPPDMPIPNGGYSQIYQLGFHKTPDTFLAQFMANEAGVSETMSVHYEYPILDKPIQEDYICIAPRGMTGFIDLFNGIADATTAVIIGGSGDYTGHGIDMTGKDMLETLSILHHAKAFVGLMSSQLVLANGVQIPRIAIHDGIHWDMHHVLYSSLNYYPVNPSVDDILSIAEKHK